MAPLALLNLATIMDWHNISYDSADRPQQLAQALREIGFAVLTHIPIEPTLVQQVYQEWLCFFQSEAKHHYRFDPQQQSGYFPLQSETAQGQTQADLKEFFHLYDWTPLPAGFSDRTQQLQQQLQAIAATVLNGLEAALPETVQQALSMPLSAMVQNSSQTLLRLIHYPPLPADRGAAMRAAAHADINLLTLLPAATAAGLEVQDRQGQWHAVPLQANSLVVNIGDMLTLASQGYYRSTPHRVVNPVGIQSRRSRLSMPFFLHPRPEVRLGDRTAQAVLQERLRELGLIESPP